MCAKSVCIVSVLRAFYSFYFQFRAVGKSSIYCIANKRKRVELRLIGSQRQNYMDGIHLHKYIYHTLCSASDNTQRTIRVMRAKTSFRGSNLAKTKKLYYLQ